MNTPLTSVPMRQRRQLPALVVLSLGIHAAAAVAVLAFPSVWPWALAVLALNHALLATVGLLPRSHWLGANWTRLPAAAAARGEVALTIDDGPDPVVTPAVLELLDRHGAKATFFCVGRQAALHPEICRDILRRGHRIENHSQLHRHNFSLLGPAGFRRELEAAQATLTAITGDRPQFFRAPAGLRNPFLDPALQRSGLRLASWTRRAYDTREGDPAIVLRKLCRSLRAGDILLLHDRHAALTPRGVPVILEVLPALLQAIRQAGLRPVTLREALT
ncbi:MAG: polysaccharide deacetylase family protein [Polaromonas sp.]|uniref:polysaccharide deacetylase family protein n=1 Tax=Polaromonas sp. TaxID=1869339 RepID=UPI00403618EB